MSVGKALAGSALCLALFATGPAARADFGGETDTRGTVVDGTPEVTVTAYGGSAVLGAATTHRQGGDIRCFYFATSGSDGKDGWGLAVDMSAPVMPEPGAIYGFYCYDGSDQVVHSSLVTFDPADPLNGLFADQRAAEEARRRLPLEDPVVTTSPPTGSDHLIGLPTFLGVGNDWGARRASATVGAVTATVIATPVRVDWDPGDGSPVVTCTGPGTSWDATQRDEACSHTYLHRSTGGAGESGGDPGGGTFTLTATITWEVRWEATTGTGGPLDPVTRTTNVPLRVVEAQAVLR